VPSLSQAVALWKEIQVVLSLKTYRIRHLLSNQTASMTTIKHFSLLASDAIQEGLIKELISQAS
jgi:hypothetical protein